MCRSGGQQRARARRSGARRGGGRGGRSSGACPPPPPLRNPQTYYACGGQQCFGGRSGAGNDITAHQVLWGFSSTRLPELRVFSVCAAGEGSTVSSSRFCGLEMLLSGGCELAKGRNRTNAPPEPPPQGLALIFIPAGGGDPSPLDPLPPSPGPPPPLPPQLKCTRKPGFWEHFLVMGKTFSAPSAHAIHCVHIAPCVLHLPCLCPTPPPLLRRDHAAPARHWHGRVRYGTAGQCVQRHMVRSGAMWFWDGVVWDAGGMGWGGVGPGKALAGAPSAACEAECCCTEWPTSHAGEQGTVRQEVGLDRRGRCSILFRYKSISNS